LTICYFREDVVSRAKVRVVSVSVLVSGNRLLRVGGPTARRLILGDLVGKKVLSGWNSMCREKAMIDLTVAVRTTVLLVDNDFRQLSLLTLIMKMSGFSVATANSPIEAISLLNVDGFRKIDVAVIDYHMPVMNGCILTAYLKARYPELKVVLYSGASDIPVDERMSLDGFISKSEGIEALLSKIVEFGQLDLAIPRLFAFESDAFIESVN
jgi:CheY-like chemotaxis protein